MSNKTTFGALLTKPAKLCQNRNKGEGENLHDEFGILKDGKHTVLKDVDEIGNLMYPYY